MQGTGGLSFYILLVFFVTWTSLKLLSLGIKKNEFFCSALVFS